MRSFVAVGAVLAILLLADASPPQGWLLTWRAQSFIQTSNCVTSDPSQMTCNQYMECFQTLPRIIRERINECRRSAVPHRTTKCFYNEPVARQPGVLDKAYECVMEVVPKLTPEQNRMIVSFEDCARNMNEQVCGSRIAYVENDGYEDYDEMDGYDSYRQDVRAMQPRQMQQKEIQQKAMQQRDMLQQRGMQQRGVQKIGMQQMTTQHSDVTQQKEMQQRDMMQQRGMYGRN